MLRPYTSEKSGMQDVDKNHVMNVVESMSTTNYKKHSEEKQAALNEKLARLRTELNTMTIQDKDRCLSETDELLFIYDQQRDFSRIVVCIDMDCYFTAVEMRDNPTLRKVPMAVGSMQMISTSNYVARKFGVRSAMPGYIGIKLCPQLIFVKGNYTKYGQVAHVYRKVFREYDPDFHSGGLDEAKLEISGFMKKRVESATWPGKAFGGDCECYLPLWNQELAGKYPNANEEQHDCEKCGKTQIVYKYEATFGKSVEDVVNEIRFRVEQETGGLTCSAGIASNGLLAKICSEQRKPNNQFLLESNRESVVNFVQTLKIRSVPGIGPTSEYLLNGLGIVTCRDLIDNRIKIWHLFTPKTRRFLLRVCSGVSSSEAHDESEPVEESKQSISHERTFEPTNNRSYLDQRLQVLTELVFESMQERGFVGCKKIAVKVKLSTFKEKSKTQSMMSAINSEEHAFNIAKRLLDKVLGNESVKVRLVGIVLSDFATEITQISNTMESYLSSASNNPAPETSNDNDDQDIIYEGRVKPEKKSKEVKESKEVKKPANSNAKSHKKPEKKKSNNHSLTDLWSKPAAKKPIPSNENDPILLEDSDNEEFYSAKKPKTT